jgi:hypothetical protein
MKTYNINLNQYNDIREIQSNGSLPSVSMSRHPNGRSFVAFAEGVVDYVYLRLLLFWP